MTGFLNLTYDPTTLPAPENNFDPLPNDDYIFKIEKAEDRESKTAGNYYLWLQLSVESAKFTNRKVFKMIHYKNANADCERRGGAELGELMRACGLTFSNSMTADAFIGRLVYGKTRITKATEKYDAANDVVKFWSVDGDAPAVAKKTPNF